jgi:hypothetical protein
MVEVAYLLPPYSAGDRLDSDDLALLKRRVTTGTYTPVLSSGAPAPVIGASGFALGGWARTGLLIDGWIDLFLSGAGVNLGGASWRITLPFDVDLTVHPVGVLNAASHNIGDFQTWSSTSADAKSGSILCSAVAEMIFYFTGSTASLGAANFTTNARMKGRFSYWADPAEFP